MASMARFTISITAIVLTLGSGSQAQRSAGDAPIRVILPAGFDATGCQFSSYVIGSFGGRGGHLRGRPAGNEFQIDTVYDGTAAKTAKGYLYCEGYQFETFAFD